MVGMQSPVWQMCNNHGKHLHEGTGSLFSRYDFKFDRTVPVKYE